MEPYAPNPTKLPATVDLPEDGVDYKVVASVREGMEAMLDGIAFIESRATATIVLIDATVAGYEPPAGTVYVKGWLVGGGGSGGAGEDTHGAGGGGTARAVPFEILMSDLTTPEFDITIGAGSNSGARGGTTTLTVDGIVVAFAEGGVSGQDSDPPAGLLGKGGNGSFGGGGGAPPNTVGGTAGGTNRTGWEYAKLGYGQGGNADAYANGGEGWGRGLDLDASDFSYAAPPMTPCLQRSNAGIGGTASSAFNGGGGGGGPGYFDSSLVAEDGDPGGTADPGVSGSGKGGRGYGAGGGGSNGIAGYAASTRSKGNDGCVMMICWREIA